jgi:glycosyltransferase involved in cell wall biosynthesis
VRKKIPDVKFTIIGDGPLLQDVKARISSLKLEKNITLMGALPRDKAFPIMNNHWIYAQHSVTAISGDKEGYAISPAEAAAHELAVVSTLHNGIPEHVKEGITGFLVPEFDYESMAQRIIQLIENPTLAEEMGKAGRENIITLNDPDKRIDCIFGLLREIYNERV